MHRKTLSLAFLSSSYFTIPILEDILAHSDLTLGQVAAKQHQQLLQKFSVNQLSPGFWQQLSHIWEENCLKIYPQLDLIITQPDTELRGKLIQNKIAEFASKNNIKTFKPFKMKAQLSECQAALDEIDLAIVASYGQIIPNDLLELPLYGMVNWHPSKLPEYRGPTPLQTALRNGDKTTALSWIEVVSKMDAGDIYLQVDTPIPFEMDFSGLATSMGKLGADTWALVAAIKILERHNSMSDRLMTDFAPKRQNFKDVTFTQILHKEDKIIQPLEMPAQEVYNHFRAYKEFPSTVFYSDYFKQQVKLVRCQKPITEKDFKQILKDAESVEKINDFYCLKRGKRQQVFLKTLSGAIEILEVCLENGKRIQFEGFNFQ